MYDHAGEGHAGEARGGAGGERRGGCGENENGDGHGHRENGDGDGERARLRQGDDDGPDLQHRRILREGRGGEEQGCEGKDRRGGA